MTATEIQKLLVEIGWPITIDGDMGSQTKTAIKYFQHGYTFANLTVDGIAGRQTREALLDCVKNQRGKCAEFFWFREFASKGNGWIKVHPRLLNRLDELRRRTGVITIVSGYRDPAHNKAVGGATSSQHVLGTAADISGVDGKIARAVGFSGLGVHPNGSVVHVDVRAEGPNNTTGAAIGNPTIWYY
jgi:hypothetical protein